MRAAEYRKGKNACLKRAKIKPDRAEHVIARKDKDEDRRAPDEIRIAANDPSQRAHTVGQGEPDEYAKHGAEADGEERYRYGDAKTLEDREAREPEDVEEMGYVHRLTSARTSGVRR